MRRMDRRIDVGKLSHGDVWPAMPRGDPTEGGIGYTIHWRQANDRLRYVMPKAHFAIPISLTSHRGKIQQRQRHAAKDNAPLPPYRMQRKCTSNPLGCPVRSKMKNRGKSYWRCFKMSSSCLRSSSRSFSCDRLVGVEFLSVPAGLRVARGKLRALSECLENNFVISSQYNHATKAKNQTISGTKT